MIKAAMYQCDKNRGQTSRLVKLAKSQGYDIEVFESPEGNTLPYGYVASFAFYHVAERLAGDPFLWLEADCSPLSAKWLELISREYQALPEGRIMVPQRNGEPEDVASGIGVYPAGMFKMLPKLEIFRKTWYCFDYWIEQNLSHLIYRTNLIQHSYQDYKRTDDKRHRFPRDSGILSDKAVLFHADKFQELFPPE